MFNLYDRLVMDVNPKLDKEEKKYFKHIGELKEDNTPVVILFRTVPKEPERCLVVGPKFLPDTYRNALMNSLKHNDAQSSFELGTYLAKQKFPGGEQMLAYLHIENFIKSFNTSQIIVTYGPGKEGQIELKKLNEMIAHDMNVSVEELAIKDDKIKQIKTTKKSNGKETAKN